VVTPNPERNEVATPDSRPVATSGTSSGTLHKHHRHGSFVVNVDDAFH
jgi:hypothetical protein